MEATSKTTQSISSYLIKTVSEISLLKSVCFRVKFRHGEPLKPLDSSRQSGGERACAIALYLLSLQVRSIAFSTSRKHICVSLDCC